MIGIQQSGTVCTVALHDLTGIGYGDECPGPDPPPPSRPRSLASNCFALIRITVLPSAKFVFPKDLSLNSSLCKG